MITKDSTSVTEIKYWIGQEKQVTRQLHSTLLSNQLSPKTNVKIYKTLVESIVTYVAEVWETKNIRGKDYEPWEWDTG